MMIDVNDVVSDLTRTAPRVTTHMVRRTPTSESKEHATVLLYNFKFYNLGSLTLSKY